MHIFQRHLHIGKNHDWTCRIKLQEQPSSMRPSGMQRKNIFTYTCQNTEAHFNWCHLATDLFVNFLSLGMLFLEDVWNIIVMRLLPTSKKLKKNIVLKSSVQKALPAKSKTKRQILMLETKQFQSWLYCPRKIQKGVNIDLVRGVNLVQGVNLVFQFTPKRSKFTPATKD